MKVLFLALYPSLISSSAVITSSGIEVTLAGSTVLVEPFGIDSLRVRTRANGGEIDDSLPGALIPPSDVVSIVKADVGDMIRNGNIEAVVDDNGLVTVTRVSDGQVILREASRSFDDSGVGSDPKSPVSNVSFVSSPTEELYGFGEHQQGRLNNKLATYDMESCLDYQKSHGGEVCIPFIFAASGGGTNNIRAVQYGFLWNMPNYGGVDFASVSTDWTAYAAPQTDYFISTYGAQSKGSQRAADIMSRYVDAVGHSPMLPDYAAGYWHSKNRYASQGALMEAAEGFHNRSVPVDVIVIDYHHWVRMGDWTFDETHWPDVEGMMKQLGDWGMRVMVSVWPFTAVNSSSIDDVQQQNLAVADSTGEAPVWWNDNNCFDYHGGQCHLLDQSKQTTRDYFWKRLNDGYHKRNISIYWLDASEPEISVRDARAAAMSSIYDKGSVWAAGMMYPYWHTRAVYDGLRSAGQQDGDIIMLTRSAWAGMQRWGAALWSGDTQSTWDSLKVSIQAGLNTQLSGIAWWTTDIGGYAGGRPSDPNFQELVVRWFQYGATCPLFRQHGARETEIWKYGDASYNAIVKVINWRRSIKDYVMAQMKLVSETGTPVNRPLWWDFPEDSKAWAQTSSFMFGPKYLVAPITEANATNWTTYLPAGAQWQYHFDSTQKFEGGQDVTLATPLDEFPLFIRTDIQETIV